MKYNYSPHFRVTAQREIEEIYGRAEERYFELSKREAGQGGSRGNRPPLCFRGLEENSSITYNNVKNITYKGTQAKDIKFIYNNVENINKEAVELNNSYHSSSKGFGIGANTSFGADGKVKGATVNVSANKSNSNKEETIYYNGNFNNVDKIHNNTKNMRLIDFNQTSGKHKPRGCKVT